MTKFKNSIRLHTILLGLGAALLLGSAARAQQEMDPAPFDDGSFVVTMAQPTPAANMALASVTSTPIETNRQAGPIAEQETEASMVSNADTSEWTTLAGWAMIASVIFIAMFFGRKIAPVDPAARQKTNHGLSTVRTHAF